jgi:hypothetical protein
MGGPARGRVTRRRSAAAYLRKRSLLLKLSAVHQSVQCPEPLRPGRFCFLREATEVDDHKDALVTASYASKRLGVSIACICMWRNDGRIQVKGRRGRSKLYRWGDLTEVERQTRRSPYGRPRTSVA